jgi:chlorite dismutase
VPAEPDPAVPTTGWGVLHLFYRWTPSTDGEALVQAVKTAEAAGDQVVTVATLGHKSDLAVMLVGEDLWRLRTAQSRLTATGLELVDSYVSLTEVSEYAKGMPAEMLKTRLEPQLPPEGKPAWCFYPMSKRRGPEHNWFTLPFEERKALMMEHGASGRTFAGRVVQLITGSTGLDDYEWGVTLFAQHPDDLKEVVYTMRFDEASANYAEFGPFVTGMVAPVQHIVHTLGTH